jgi:hypothetical protein
MIRIEFVRISLKNPVFPLYKSGQLKSAKTGKILAGKKENKYYF